MGKEGIFSTPRQPALTGDQMLENLINKRNAQRANMNALTEAAKLGQSVPDFTATLESSMQATEGELKRTSAMENLAYTQGSKNLAMTKLGLRSRMITEGREYVRGKVLGELVYASYWLDDEVKECATEQIEDTVEEMMDYIEENFSGSKVAESKQSVLMKNLNIVIEETVKKAADRICEECESDDSVFPDFELTDAEEDELDEKLVDLGKDEIVDLIKSKVAQVVQDEKEKGQERAELFREIDELSQDTEDTDEEPTEAEEATLAGIRSGEITLEGATWDTLKVVFSDNKKKAKAAYKSAAKLAKNKRYNEAIKEYETAKKIFKEMLDDIKSTDESAMGTVCSFLLTGWLEHAFIASIGGPSTAMSVTKAICSSLSASFGLQIPFAIISRMSTNEENIKKSRSNDSSNDYKVHAIAALNVNIEACDAMIKECKAKSRSGNGKNRYSMEGMTVPFSPNEQHMASLMESGVDVRLLDDPSWGELKSFVSMMCKLIREALSRGVNRANPESSHEKYTTAKCLIEDLETKLSDIPETVPGDVKEFIMAMVNSIYGAVPQDSVIISRFGNPMGSPDLKSSIPAVNLTTVSWTDLFVNIKTNLSAIKSYCDDQVSPEVITQDDINSSDCPVSGRNSLAQLTATAQARILTKNIGGSLFESMMLGAISTCSESAMESSLQISDDQVENAALIESILRYTVLESLDTIGLYKFRMNDINAMKREFMKPVSESRSIMMSGGKDKKGKKRVRINTRKMKKKKDINGNPVT